MSACLGAKTACGSKQLCAGLEAGIEGSVHAVLEQLMADGGMQFGKEEADLAALEPPAATADDSTAEGPDADSGTAEEWARLFTQPGQEELEATTDDAGEEQLKLLLVVNAANSFNNLSRLAMLWIIRHHWPKMTRFAFNAYRHQWQQRLCVGRAGLATLVLLSMEGVTQGDPLTVALYGVALLPLIEHLRQEYPRVLQPWYANDDAMRGTGRDVAACFHEMCRVGPQYGYFTEPAK